MNEYCVQKIGKTLSLYTYLNLMSHQLKISMLTCWWKKSKIHIFSIVTTRDHAREVKIDQVLFIGPVLEPFFVLLIETHSLELAAISLTYFVKIFVNNPAKKTKITTYPHWSYVWWWWHGEWIWWHYYKSEFIVNPYRDQHHWREYPTMWLELKCHLERMKFQPPLGGM